MTFEDRVADYAHLMSMLTPKQLREYYAVVAEVERERHEDEVLAEAEEIEERRKAEKS